MRKITPLIIVLCLSSALSANPIRPFDIGTLERLGNEMFKQDIRAARATDIVRTASIDLASIGARGWIVVEDEAKTTVRFFGEKEGRFQGLIDVTFVGKEDGTLVKYDAFPLPEAEAKLVRARLAVTHDLAKTTDLCSSSYNVITLPDPDGSGFLVWTIAANMNAHEVQIGGHFRYTISESGETIESKDRLYKSCLVLSLKPKDLPKGATLAGLSMGWIVSDTPLEIHVFLQRHAKLPFMIATTANHKMWEVDQGKIVAKN